MAQHYVHMQIMVLYPDLNFGALKSDISNIALERAMLDSYFQQSWILSPQQST